MPVANGYAAIGDPMGRMGAGRTDLREETSKAGSLNS